ncbi:MAG TPA: redoxin domain-containing protein, partial [Stellaceae bacterium]|nr:redoxin domain-containing protein [Stellaceae bacterium]
MAIEGARTMMKRLPVLITGLAIVVLVFSVSFLPRQARGVDTAPRPGASAPAFTAADIAGRTVNLGDYRGKTVILEWTNDGCPFVGKHYNSGNMQGLQRRFTAQGDVWLTVASSAPGEQGYVTPDQARADIARWQAAPSDFLLDPDGALGHLYDARATPHMVVIDAKGVLAYIGAIDNKPSTDVEDVKVAKNYVAAALDELASGKPVTVAAV